MKRILIGLAIAVVIELFLFSRIDLGELRAVLVLANWPVLALGIGFKAIAYYVRARRWAFAMEVATGERPKSRVFAASMVGYAANLVLPARMGDLARVEILVRHNPLSRTLALTSFWLAALVDYCLLSACLVALTVGGVLSGLVGPIPPLLALLAAGAILLLFHWIAGSESALEFGGRPILERLPKRLEKPLRSALHALQLCRSPRGLLSVSVLSLIVWSLESIGTGLALLAFHLPAGFAIAVGVTIALSLSFVFPLTPGNVGTHQLVSVLVLGLFGVAEADALAFSVGSQAAAMAYVIGVGAAFLFREGASSLDALKGRQMTPELSRQAADLR